VFAQQTLQPKLSRRC